MFVAPLLVFLRQRVEPEKTLGLLHFLLRLRLIPPSHHAQLIAALAGLPPPTAPLAAQIITTLFSDTDTLATYATTVITAGLDQLLALAQTAPALLASYLSALVSITAAAARLVPPVPVIAVPPKSSASAAINQTVTDRTFLDTPLSDAAPPIVAGLFAFISALASHAPPALLTPTLHQLVTCGAQLFFAVKQFYLFLLRTVTQRLPTNLF